MKKMMNPLVIVSLITGCSTFQHPEATRATASDDHHRRPNYNGHYDGPPGEFKRDQWERRPSTFSYCDKYRNDTGKHVLACGAGVEEAMNMASRFAGGHGKEDGYLKGYAWGMNQSIRYYQDSNDEMLRGEDSVETLNSRLSNAITEGSTAGSRDGDSLGTSEAKGRFYQAIDTKNFPSPNYQAPVANFNPTQDAYSRYIGQIPTAEEILKRDRYGRIGFYDSYDRTYGGGGDWHERNGRDMWSRDGVYGVNSNQWVQGDSAFQRWLQIPTPGRQRYNGLNVVAFNEVETGRYPAQAVPRGGDRPNNPNPNPRPNPPATPPVTPPVTPPLLHLQWLWPLIFRPSLEMLLSKPIMPTLLLNILEIFICHKIKDKMTVKILGPKLGLKLPRRKA
jgi:hypothetical protein